MSRYIDADALLQDWKIDIEPIKNRPIQMDEFREFMRRYENHPYYFAILAIALATTADVVEITPCKDCVYARPYNSTWQLLIKKDALWCAHHDMEITQDWFCADAIERTVADE